MVCGAVAGGAACGRVPEPTTILADGEGRWDAAHGNGRGEVVVRSRDVVRRGGCSGAVAVRLAAVPLRDPCAPSPRRSRNGPHLEEGSRHARLSCGGEIVRKAQAGGL